MLFRKFLLSVDFRRKQASSVLTLNMRFPLDWSSRVEGGEFRAWDCIDGFDLLNGRVVFSIPILFSSFAYFTS